MAVLVVAIVAMRVSDFLFVRVGMLVVVSVCCLSGVLVRVRMLVIVAARMRVWRFGLRLCCRFSDEQPDYE